MLCLYHWPCPDGATAALCLHAYYEWGWRERTEEVGAAAGAAEATGRERKSCGDETTDRGRKGGRDEAAQASGVQCVSPSYSAVPTTRVVYVPNTTYDPATVESLGLLPTDTVYLLDFSGPPNFLAALLRSPAQRVVLLDHHKTAFQALAELRATEGGEGTEGAFLNRLETVVDMHRSGAGIALDYFFPARDDRVGVVEARHESGTGRSPGSPDTDIAREPAALGGDRAVALGGNAAASAIFPSSSSPPASPASPRAHLLPLVRFIQDADLWLWRVDGSRLFHAGFGVLGLDLDARRNPGVFRELATLDLERVQRIGEEEDARIRRLEELARQRAFLVRVGGSRGVKGAGPGQENPVCLGAYLGSEDASPSLRSRLGNALAAHSRERGLEPVAVLAYVEEEMKASSRGRYKISLRSLGDWDTTRVTELWGGGGHRNASGCTINRDVFEREWVDADVGGRKGTEAA